MSQWATRSSLVNASPWSNRRASQGGRGTTPDHRPTDVQTANGVVDLRIEDEPAAVVAAKRYLSYFTHAPGRETTAKPAESPPPREGKHRPYVDAW